MEEREEAMNGWQVSQTQRITPMDCGYETYLKNKLYKDELIFNNINEL